MWHFIQLKTVRYGHKFCVEFFYFISSSANSMSLECGPRFCVELLKSIIGYNFRKCTSTYDFFHIYICKSCWPGTRRFDTIQYCVRSRVQFLYYFWHYCTEVQSVCKWHIYSTQILKSWPTFSIDSLSTVYCPFILYNSFTIIS